ncbi:MAG: hypothetical protein IJB73_05220 [Firmicutes bacterium]|nr:hypothetical protein [Bacillota bacterium]
MKKLLVLLLALMMVFSTFTACGNNNDVEVGGDDVQQDQPLDEQQPVDGEGEEGEADVEDEQQPADTEEEKEEEPADKEE